MRISNRTCSEAVASLTPFKGSNLSGEIIDDCHGRFYVVQSYGWWPLLVCRLSDGVWFKNTQRYSVSTARQLSDCTPYDLKAIAVDHEGIKAILNGE